MENILKFTIITPEKAFYTGDILDVNVENETGRIGILPEHVDMVTILIPSVTSFTDKSGKTIRVFTSSGIISIKDDEVRIMCDAAEYPEQIDLQRAEEAKERAEKRLETGKNVDLKRAEVALMRAMMRIKTKSNWTTLVVITTKVVKLKGLKKFFLSPFHVFIVILYIDNMQGIKL